MLRDFLNIKKLKKQEQNSSRDEKLNKNLLHRKNKNKNKAEKRLKRASKMKKYQLEKTGEISRKKRIRIALLIVTTVFLALIIRVAWIQFHNGDSLQQMAYLQQTLDRKINPKRGTIYDATGKTVLATSSSVETITINPVNISKENKEKVARKFAELFELDYEKVLKKNEGHKHFILHDGPPYANGEIHAGHALNKILKDTIVRFKNLEGYYTPYVPGFDTHGLPTERKAIEVLVEEEILIKKQGIGTFVADKKLIRDASIFMGFTESCRQDGKVPSSRLLSADLSEASGVDQRNLNLEEGEMVIRVRRLRFCDGAPTVLEMNHFSQKYAFLLGTNLEGSLYEILEQHGIYVVAGKRKITICYATKEEAELLNVKENDALLMMKDLCQDAHGEVIHSCKSIINPQYYDLTFVSSVERMKWEKI